MSSLRRALLLAAAVALIPASSLADRRYFVQSYTPFLAPAGTLELELWTNARNGQGDSTNTSWQNRAEFEYAITNRLTGAFYLNFTQSAGESSAMRFDGPSVELIYLLGERGSIPLDPAVYLEVRENGDELEIEPKLLLAHRHGRVIGVANLIGEFETHHTGDEAGEMEKSLRVTTGLSREFGSALSIGFEALYLRELEESAGNPSAIFGGPSINLQSAKLQLALGWHPQLWGDPATAGNLDLNDFARSELRLILGTDL
jgi:hypothetical protein